MIKLLASHVDDRPEITIIIDSEIKNEHATYKTSPTGYEAVISDALNGTVSLDGRLITDNAAMALDIVALFERELGYDVEYIKSGLLVEHTGDHID